VDVDPLRRRLASSGAWLFAIGMVTGLCAAAVLTERVSVTLPRLALSAHLNALLGGMWLVLVGSTLDMLHYGDIGRRRLAWVVMVPAWANWLITLIASVLGVTGLQYTHDTANNAVAALLHSLVVLPSLVGAFAWAWGLTPVSRVRR
jgi:(hydroxyamino)benzene mutase